MMANPTDGQLGLAAALLCSPKQLFECRQYPAPSDDDPPGMGRHAYLFQSDFPSQIQMPAWLQWHQGRMYTGEVNPSGEDETLYRLKCLMLAEAMIMAEACRVLETAKRTTPPPTPETEKTP